MGRPNKSTDIEREYGRPLLHILVELYAELGKGNLVAQRLGVSPGTLSVWVDELGLQPWTILVDKNGVPVQVGEDVLTKTV